MKSLLNFLVFLTEHKLIKISSHSIKPGISQKSAQNGINNQIIQHEGDRKRSKPIINK